MSLSDLLESLSRLEALLLLFIVTLCVLDLKNEHTPESL